ncbi:MAG TPA: undecaprenyl-diphosphate phosphatase [Methylomirabilota bacterium]|nr:undecaprenyl-diphosphate phosphatase [Methylomirabilota bacterium]
MPEWVQVIILGIIEGITEFLPISSTGHMLIAEHWLPAKQTETFIAVVQGGAVLAVLLVFTERLKQLLKRWHEPETKQFFGKLALAFVITAIGGLVLKKFDFELEQNATRVAWATLIGGVLILMVEAWLKKKTPRAEVSWLVAAAVGVGQLLAIIFPGLSRSGSTILLALGMGTERKAATEFSFLLGIPTLLSAGAYTVLKTLKGSGDAVKWDMVLLGSVVAAITAFATVRWLLRFVQTHTFNGFGWYRIILGIVLLLFFL